MSKAKKKKFISYILRFSVAFIALYLTFRGENFGKVADVLLGLNLWVFAVAMGSWFISQSFFVARWSLLLKVQGINIGFWTAYRLHLLGTFYNNCLPTSVGGDVLRAWYVTTHTDKKLEAALSVFVDRIIGLTGMIVMAFCCYWFVPSDEQQGRLTFSFNLNLLQRLNEYKWILAIVGIIFALVFLAFIANRRGRNLLAKAFRVFCERAKVVLAKVNKAIRIYYRKKLAIALALVLTFCCQAVFIVGLWFVGRDIGINVPMRYYFVFFPIAWILGALPISIGALGIWEGTLKLLFSRVAIGLSAKLSALALSHRIIWLLWSLPGVVIHLIGAHLPKDFFIDSENSIK